MLWVPFQTGRCAHHDPCYYPKPDAATFLYALEIPSKGGNTRFSNMYKAYENLPNDLKTSLKGRRVLQIYNYGTVEKADPDGDLRGSDMAHSHFYSPS